MILQAPLTRSSTPIGINQDVLVRGQWTTELLRDVDIGVGTPSYSRGGVVGFAPAPYEC